MPLGIRRWTRDANGRLSTRLEMYPAREAYRKLWEFHNAECSINFANETKPSFFIKPLLMRS
jgi:hypothetical protein